jgi:hypothetical protein
MKRIIIAILCVSLSACATFRNLPNERKSELVSYYKSFSGGLKFAVDVAVVVKPDLEPAANKAKLAICALDKAVDSYEVVLSETMALEAHEAAKKANEAVAAVISGQDESALESFLDPSTPEA